MSTGHVLNDLDSPGDVARALRELAGAVRPGGLLALDLMTERFARAHERCGEHARVEEDWAVVTPRLPARSSPPAPPHHRVPPGGRSLAA